MRASAYLGEDYTELQKRLDEITKDLVEEAKSITGPINQSLFHWANEIRNYIIDSMKDTEVDSSKSYKAGRAKPHHPSMPGHPPAVDKGNLISSLVYEFGDLQVEIGSDQTEPPYPVYLEDGTSKMAARPWLAPAVEEYEDDMMEQLGESLEILFKRGD